MLKISPIFEVFVKQFSFEFEMSWKLKNHESRKNHRLCFESGLSLICLDYNYRKKPNIFVFDPKQLVKCFQTVVNSFSSTIT